jgi:hypothetical protein
LRHVLKVVIYWANFITARRCVVYLLGLAQDWYEAEDEKERQELRLETFINWTWLEYSSFADDGSYSLWFYDEDGKIFAGHVITAEYDAEGQFKAQAFTANA